MKSYNLIFLLLITLFSNCKEKGAEQSNLFAKAISLGSVDDRLLEASGLVESIANPKHFWTLNDSGNPAEVFLIDQNASIKLVCKLANIENRDFEDIAIGAGPEEGKNYIYVADIGDNLEKFGTKLIYRFEEPTLPLNEGELLITQFDTIQIRLPDKIRDTETIMIDPITSDMYMVSKREDSVRLYSVHFPFEKNIIEAQFLVMLPFHKIVAGSISTHGSEVLLKDYEQVYYWKNSSGLSLPKLLQTTPKVLVYDREPQGESICWDRDGSGYYTLSEKVKDKNGKLLFYKRN